MGFKRTLEKPGQINDSTLVKLEENYRSTSTILEAANSLISNNKERIDKVLRATRGEGEPIKLTRCDDEIAEAEAVIHRLRILDASNPELNWGDMAILYRTMRNQELLRTHCTLEYSIHCGWRITFL